MTIRATGALLCALGFLCASSAIVLAQNTVVNTSHSNIRHPGQKKSDTQAPVTSSIVKPKRTDGYGHHILAHEDRGMMDRKARVWTHNLIQ